MATETVYDILIFGAGPAGASAALFAASKGLKVAVVHHPPSPATGPQPEWLHPKGAALLAEQGADHREAVLGTIDRARFVDTTCKREMRAALGKKIDVVDGARLTDAMLARARSGGAEVFTEEVTTIQVGERTVRLVTRNGGPFTGKVLIAADGGSSLASRSFDLERETAAGKRTLCCQAVVGKIGPQRRQSTRPAAELTLLLASDDLSSFGYSFAVGEAHVLGLVAPASSGDARTAFNQAVTRWTEAGFMPAGVHPAKLAVEIREVPRGLALDFDTHVGKNTLFIGDAGGYVAAVSHEGVYPAIWSASLAVGVCGDALASANPQDALIEFDSRWRREMADYLRPPNSDLRFLLPLIFSNQRMAEKLAQAFFFGTNL
jgi:flavin-dependent dehydrogenase